MPDILLARDKSHARSLGEVAQRVFSLLNLGVSEERESSHYVDGHYFVGHAANVAVKVYYADDPEMPDFRYAVVLASQVLRKDVPHSIEAHPNAVATKLAADGFDVFVTPPRWGRVDCDQQGTHYRSESEKP